MLNYIRAYVKKDNHWREEDISNRTILELKSNYQNVLVVATYNTETTERGIDFNNNRYALSTAVGTDTLNDWIQSVNVETLIFDFNRVSFNSVKCIRHRNLDDMPVKVEGANSLLGEDVPIPIGMKKDLMITSSSAEYTEFSTENISRNMLLAINGRICKTDYVDGRTFVLDAFNKVWDGGNVISAIDFTDVGGLEQSNITSDMVKVVPQSPTDISMNRQRCVVDIPEVIGVDVTPIIVLDGYLHILDGTYKRLSKDKMLINVNIELALKRASKFKQIEHLFVDYANVRHKGIDGSSFDVLKYLDETDSFMVFVKSSDLCIYREPLQQTNTYGGYEHYRAPKGIIISEEYEYMPHIYQEASEEHVAISVMDNRESTNIFKKQLFDITSGFSDNKHTNIKPKYKKAYALEIYVL